MMKKIIAFLILSSIISGCSGQKITSNAVVEPSSSLEVFFCPRDSCEDLFVLEIERASQKVHCAFFELNSEKLISALEEKSVQIEVAVVVDEMNYEDQIDERIVKKANAVQYMHNKFCIIDGKKVITGSANPTKNDLLLNNNNILMIESRQMVQNYELEFWELWQGIYAKGAKTDITNINASSFFIENYFCPDDDCTSQVIREVKKAKHNVYFMAFSFTDEGIADAMLMQNVDIKGVMEARNINGLGSQFGRLQGFGIDIIKDKNPRTMHHKVFIIDNETVITGSYNPTKSANTRNDENMLIIHDKSIASQFVEEFLLVRGTS